MTGLLSSLTAYEKITISASLSRKTSNQYNVTIVVINDGTLPTNVTAILINGEDTTSNFNPNPKAITILPGTSQTFYITQEITVTPGKGVKITVVTLRGSYETQLTAP
jgi:hypothetical protein